MNPPKIANLLPPDALDGGTKMALVNAAYFKVVLDQLIKFVNSELMFLQRN